MSRAALVALFLAALAVAVGCADDDPPTEDPWCRQSGAIVCPRITGTSADGGFTLDAGSDGA